MAAKERPRRAIAGANMAKLILQEDEDEFYKTAYGGFSEEDTDREYTTEADLTDVIDSDFDSLEVSDVPMSDSNDEHKKKHKTWDITFKPKRHPPDTTKTEKKGDEKMKQPMVVLSVSRRSTTAVKSEISKIRREHEQKNKPKRKSVKKEWKMPTQEEILEEAKRTEEKNLELLDTFRRHEEQKKKTKASKRAHMGVYIRFHSIAAPIVKFGNIPNSPQHGNNYTTEHKVTALRYCTRNFITFSDPRIVPSFLQKTTKVNPPEKLYCPVTRLPAKYMDPLTLTPFATVKAFKMIRESFAAYEDMRNEEQSSGSKRSRKRATEDS